MKQANLFAGGLLAAALLFGGGCGFWTALKGAPAGNENRPGPFQADPRRGKPKAPAPERGTATEMDVTNLPPPDRINVPKAKIAAPSDGKKKDPGRSFVFGGGKEMPLVIEGLTAEEEAIVRAQRGEKKSSNVFGGGSFRDAEPVFSDEMKSVKTGDGGVSGR